MLSIYLKRALLLTTAFTVIGCANGVFETVRKVTYPPDFNYISLRGNAVLRWEYMPGSTLYLVWTQSKNDVEPIGDFYFEKSMNRMFDLQPDNIFMLKFSYWLGI